MSELIRFGVSLEKKLLSKFDNHIKEKNYSTRSKAIADLINDTLLKKEWIKGGNVVGAITLVYDHHKRELVNKLTSIQHDFQNVIISTQHIHLDHDNCLEIIAVKGAAMLVQKISNKLKSIKGIKNGTLSISTGKGVL